jgi:transmembrane sensor
LAACATIAAVALFIYQTRTPEFSTSVGEQKTVALADTSVITLNALSKIEVHLENTERDIQLSQGEALFTVAHDARRPFKVHTRAGTVQAVGTQFNVYDRPDGDTRVSVLEGRVLLTARGAAGDGSGEASELLGAGEEADIRLDGTIQRKADAVVANTVAWRQRRLVFENAALDEMVAEFNRYNRALRLRLEDIPASTYRYSGVFDAADPESFISLLAREPDLAIERRADEVIVRPRVER